MGFRQSPTKGHLLNKRNIKDGKKATGFPYTLVFFLLLISSNHEIERGKGNCELGESDGLEVVVVLVVVVDSGGG